MKYSKIIGWILLAAGIVLISWALISSYDIFTVKTEAPAFFEVEMEELTTSAQSEPSASALQTDPQQVIEKIMGEQLKEVLPLDVLLKMLNLIVWSMLVFILIFGGGQISSLGIKLIKK